MLKTILIVEDDADTRAIYAAALSARGYRVLTASQGAEGVHFARRHRPNLILMDIRMPVMDGRDAMQYLKTDPQTESIPIWGISAYLSEQDAEALSGRIGFDHLIPKPISPQEMAALVESRIGPPGGMSPPYSPAPVPGT